MPWPTSRWVAATRTHAPGGGAHAHTHTHTHTPQALRVFVESVLRYGVPPNFAPVVLQVQPKNHKKLRAALQELYGHLTPSTVVEDAGGGAAGGPSALLDTKEFYPYVYIPINVHK